jgi:hypothetical protein
VIEVGLKAYLIIVGIVLLGLALALFYRRLSVMMRGISVIGRVVAHEVSTIDESTSYLPVVEFIDKQGTLHRLTSGAGWNDPRPKIGAEVTVCYLQADPNKAYIQSFLHLWAAPVACAVLGLAAFAAIWH